MIDFLYPQEHRNVCSRRCCAENDSVRNVFRPPMWSKKLLHLRPFRLCYVFYHRSDCCARDDSVRSVWRASFEFFNSDLATPSRRPNRRCFAPTRISAFAVLNLHWVFACGEFLCRKWWTRLACGDNFVAKVLLSECVESFVNQQGGCYCYGTCCALIANRF